MSNKWRDFEAKVRPVYIILAFLIAFTAMNRCEAEMRYEIGAGFLSGEYSNGQSLMVTEKFKNRYSVGLGYITDQEVTDRSGDTYFPDSNLFVQVQRHVEWREMELALGAAYFNATNRALGSKFTATLSVHWNFSEDFSIGIRHYSNAGSAAPNMGQDLLLLGWRF